MGRKLIAKRAAASRTPRKTGRIDESKLLDAAEATELYNQLEAEAAADRSWKAMTAVEPDDSDRWVEVEEHLLQKVHEHDHKLRRWKYFSK